MSPHRATPFVHQVASVLSLDTGLSVVAVAAAGGATTWALVSGYHLILAAAVVLAMIADVFCGARRAWKASPRTFTKERLRSAPWDKGGRMLGAILIGGAGDLAMAIFGRFVQLTMTVIGVDPHRAHIAAEAGSMGVLTMLTLAAVFAAEFVSAVDNFRSTERDVDMGWALMLARLFSVFTSRAVRGIEGPVPARREADAALRELQQAGLAPPVPGEGMVPAPPTEKGGSQ
jgi:hypothetical protein